MSSEEVRNQGHLFVFEGPDGVGKTSIALKVSEKLSEAGLSCVNLAFTGGNELGTLGHLVYRLHHRPEKVGVEQIPPVSLQLLHVAAHIDVIERRIYPALQAGHIVLLDRYWWSTWAYGLASGVTGEELNAMLEVEQYTWRGVVPSLVFLLCRRESNLAQRPIAGIYDRLVETESTKYPVMVVWNDSTLEDAVAAVMRGIEEFVGGGPPTQRR